MLNKALALKKNFCPLEISAPLRNETVEKVIQIYVRHNMYVYSSD